MLELNNISKTYHGPEGEVKALANINLTVKAGEFLAINGPSGCGKSTLLLICGTLLLPDTGKITIFGDCPQELSREKRSRFRAENLGFVFQRFHLTPYLNVLENVMSPTLAIPRKDARKQADELLRRFGLENRRRHRPSELSAGERQRVGMARALFNSPRLLLADEPTGNLDPDSSDIVLQALREFSQDNGIVIMVTHDRNAAEQADRTLSMSAGTIKDSNS